jgi:hypothetical protein
MAMVIPVAVAGIPDVPSIAPGLGIRAGPPASGSMQDYGPGADVQLPSSGKAREAFPWRSLRLDPTVAILGLDPGLLSVEKHSQEERPET